MSEADDNYVKVGEPAALPDESGYGRVATAIFLGIILLGLAGAAYHSCVAQVDPDELEHLHATWLWRGGIQPFTGFFEHHPPLYWIVLRPILASVQDGDLESLVIRARLFSWLIAAGTVIASWWFFRALFGCKAAWPGTALFALYAALSAHVTAIRPDVPSLLLLIVGSALAINGLGIGVHRDTVSRWRAFLAGVLLSAACCMLTKAVFWFAFLLAGLAAFAIWQRGRRTSRPYVAAVGLLIAGAAIPLAIQLAWIFTQNDLATFWYCNVKVNSVLVASVSKNLMAVYYAWNGLWAWPAISTPLAAVGFGHLLGSRQPFAVARKLVVLPLVASCVLLILLGNGPWPQYHMPLLLMLAGLAGVGLTIALDHCQARAGTIALAALAGLGAAWLFVLLICRYDLPESPLEVSLAPLKHVLANARPGDTYAAVQHSNPVFMMDADPKIFMKLVCLHDEVTFDEFARTVHARRPRYIIGVGANSWLALGKFSVLRGEMSDRGLSVAQITQRDSSVVRLNEMFLGRYRPVEPWQGFICERQE